ncbi:oxidoreductase [Planctomycetaceae bacterium SCGC AG-212-F19]|nr:oxidoreductase [Planctomycetaceae bacterium SCGC AG-212-F19]
MARLRLAVIGVGHLGKEHARILAGLPDVELVGVVDINADQAQTIARQHNTRAFTAVWPVLPLIDAAIIAVPTCNHHATAIPFLERGIPLLIEKPLTTTLADAQQLIELARRHSTILQVGHIERFNPAFEALVQRPMQPKYVECERLGRFTGRSVDIGAVLDLMIHDLDLLLALVPSQVTEVRAIGAAVFGGHEDMVNARLAFANGCVANMTASRISPRPLRRMRVWAPEGYAKVDFGRRRLTLVQPSEQVRQCGLDPRRLPPAARATIRDDLFGKYLEMQEVECQRTGDQLTRELQDFVQSVQAGRQPRVTGEDGLNAMTVADWILREIGRHAWNGRIDGPKGASSLPDPVGQLFPPPDQEAAA